MKRLLAILIVAVMLFSLTACNPSPAAEKPATPSNVSADDKGLITWDAVDGAIGYVITIDGTDYSVTANSLPGIFRNKNIYLQHQGGRQGLPTVRTYADIYIRS